MSKDKYQDQYKEVFQELKEEKMEWSFDDFLQKAQDVEEVPVVELHKKPSAPKWFWMAATVTLLLGISMFILNKKQNSISNEMVKSEVIKQRENFINENQEDAESSNMVVIEKDSIVDKIRDSISQIKSLAEKDALDEILSNKARIKKERKPKYVQNSYKADSTIQQDAYVIVNGQKITNEKEAMDVAAFSLLNLREKFKNTMATSQNAEHWSTDY